MTHDLNKDIQCHVGPYPIACLQITRPDIRPNTKWAVSLAMQDGFLNLPPGFVYGCSMKKIGEMQVAGDFQIW